MSSNTASDASGDRGGSYTAPIVISDSNQGFSCVRYICERELLSKPLSDEEIDCWVEWTERGRC